jgi:hypothetical protein
LEKLADRYLDLFPPAPDAMISRAAQIPSPSVSSPDSSAPEEQSSFQPAALQVPAASLPKTKNFNALLQQLKKGLR